MKPVKLLDAAFLHGETAATPMHVGALFLLDEIPARARRSFFKRFRAMIGSRLGASEVFTRRLARLPLDLANPMWVTTGDVDLDYHVRRSVLPRPGTLRQLENRVARLHESLLDRDRPLWELHLIEGLAGGRAALYAKVHHAGLDGHSAQLFLQAFVDTAPRLPSAASGAPLPEADDRSPLRLLAAGASHQLHELRELPGRLAAMASAAARLLRARAASTPETPRTVLNEVISGRRAFATTEIPLDDARSLARRAQGTVNDVVLAVTAGALRRWLLQRGLLPGQPLFAGVPVSARAHGDTEHAIQVAFISVNLHTGVADPLARLAAIHRSADAAKSNAGASKSLIPDDVPSIGLPWLLGGIARLVSHPDVADRVPLPFNLIVSNVPGPPMTLYVAGARVTTYLPISIVYHGVGLNVSAFSYDGKLFVGVTSCTDLMPDPDLFARDMLDELALLEAALEATPARRARKKTPAAGRKARPKAKAAPRGRRGAGSRRRS
jgi:diacylglycerol O-acyltransferase